MFTPGGNLGIFNLSAHPAQIPSRSCLALVYQAHVFLLGKVLEGKGRALREVARCPLPNSPPALAPLLYPLADTE